MEIRDPATGPISVAVVPEFTTHWQRGPVDRIAPIGGDIVSAAAFVDDSGSLVARDLYVNIAQLRGRARDTRGVGFMLDPVVVPPTGRNDGRGGQVLVSAATEVLHSSKGGAITPYRAEDFGEGTYVLAIGFQEPGESAVLHATRLII